MDRMAREKGRRFTHYLQTNLISYSPTWNEVIQGIFHGSLGTSMDYPNVHRRLFKGGVLLTLNYGQKGSAKHERIGVIAVLHQGSLKAGPEKFYRYFAEELGLEDFQVNTPFPGGPASELEGRFKLDAAELADFLAGLFDIWMARGFSSGVKLGPFDASIDHFTGQQLACHAFGKKIALTSSSRWIPKARRLNATAGSPVIRNTFLATISGNPISPACSRPAPRGTNLLVASPFVSVLLASRGDRSPKDLSPTAGEGRHQRRPRQNIRCRRG